MILRDGELPVCHRFLHGQNIWFDRESYARKPFVEWRGEEVSHEFVRFLSRGLSFHYRRYREIQLVASWGPYHKELALGLLL